MNLGRPFLLKSLAAALGLLTCLTAVTAPASAMAEDAPKLTFVFEEFVTLGEAITPGPTALGKRYIIPITGGTFEGPGDGAGIKGTIVPGGWDWQLGRADGCLQVKADYMLKTEDGAVINIVNQGPMCFAKEGGMLRPFRSEVVFEPPLGKYQWLGQASFIGTLESATVDDKPAVHIRIYRAD